MQSVAQQRNAGSNKFSHEKSKLKGVSLKCVWQAVPGICAMETVLHCAITSNACKFTSGEAPIMKKHRAPMTSQQRAFLAVVS